MLNARTTTQYATDDDRETQHDISALIPDMEEPEEPDGDDSNEITKDVISQLMAPELIQFPPPPPFMTSDQMPHSEDMDICKPCSDDDTVETENASLESQGCI